MHRDLKPENLFLTKDGRVKILDFGLAKLVPTPAKSADGRTVTVAEHTEPGVVMGTVGYMSPEQVLGQAADPRSDIFAIGTILYEMVTGKPTFRKPTKAETMAAILNEDPPSISQLAPTTPPGWQRVVYRCLEKDPEQRFHSAHDLAFALEALSDPAITWPSGGHGQESKKPNRARIAIAGAATGIVLIGAVLAYFWTQPPALPKVSNYVQLTHDGQPKQLVGTDGSRLYLYLSGSKYQGLAEMSLTGGEPRKISLLPSTKMNPLSLSADGSELLVMDAQGVPPRGPLWSVPVLGGSPRRLGETEGQDAACSPDGKILAYSNGGDLFVAKADGSEPRKLFTMKAPALVDNPVWSPDGSHLRFDARDRLGSPRYIWEVAVNGTALHRLLPGWNKPADSHCCGRWTADGEDFVFQSRGQIWTLPRKGGFFGSQPKPIQLTFSPMGLRSPVPSRDGKKLFLVGRTFRGELMRYDSKSGQFVSFLGGISAEYIDFSKDGQWVAYVSYPEGTLWRSKVDGSERLQLTYPPDFAFMPRWSPDDKNIVFFETIAGKPSRICEVSPEGGNPRQLLPDDPSQQWDPNWSPDGSKVVFAGNPSDAASTVRILDLATRQVSTLPGSQGLFSPRWSSDGLSIPALSADNTRLLVFDFQTQKWTGLARSNLLGWPNWSKDGQYLHVIDFTGTGAILKIRLSDRKIERVADLKNFVSTGHYGPALALAPDDSPLLLRDAGTQDVYALDWEEP